MIVTTDAIVISKLKYRDNDLIVRCYTKHLGIVSFLLYGVMFLAEVLAGALREEEPNPALYAYLENTLMWLDVHDQFANFHLLFLLKLSKYLGFYPEMTNMDDPYFNLLEGHFETHESGKYTISGAQVKLLKTLLTTPFEHLHDLKINAQQRQAFLNLILLYFELHLGSFKTPKSLEILNQVFH